MEILYSDSEGKVVLNPPDLGSFVRNSIHKGAGIVLLGKDALVGTAYIDHCSMMELAGITPCLFNLDVDSPSIGKGPFSSDPATATLRGGVGGDGKVSIEIWHRGDLDQLDALCDRLSVVLNHVKDHRKLRGFDHFELVIYDDDYVQSHVYTDEGLEDVRHHLSDPSSSPLTL
jgi:hypothetical protein